MKILIKWVAIVLCLGKNKENCSWRPSDKGTFKFGIEILLTGMRSPAVSPNRFCSSDPMLRYLSFKKLSGTSKTVFFGPFSMKTGSWGRSNSNNRFFLSAIFNSYIYPNFFFSILYFANLLLFSNFYHYQFWFAKSSNKFEFTLG